MKLSSVLTLVPCRINFRHRCFSLLFFFCPVTGKVLSPQWLFFWESRYLRVIHVVASSPFIMRGIYIRVRSLLVFFFSTVKREKGHFHLGISLDFTRIRSECPSEICQRAVKLAALAFSLKLSRPLTPYTIQYTLAVRRLLTRFRFLDNLILFLNGKKMRGGEQKSAHRWAILREEEQSGQMSGIYAGREGD